MKLQFSGHDSFICKSAWLKKGYDFVVEGNNSFNDEMAVVDLGVGKNMVTAISYWLKAFGITDQSGEPTKLANHIFGNHNGYDPYLENLGTIWLLHYSLIKEKKASIYSVFFNEFRKDRVAFTKEQLANFLIRKLDIQEQKNVNVNTVNADIAVFLRYYVRGGARTKKMDIEDELSNLFIDLELMDSYASENAEGRNVEWYRFQSDMRIDLPAEIVLFTILDNENYGLSIPFTELMKGNNSPGSVFALNEEGLFSKIDQLQKTFKYITYSEAAGIRELQFTSKPDKWKILHDYYKA